jgi:diacylglycerol kinase (ATP)
MHYSGGMPLADERRVQIVVTPGSGEGRALETARRLRMLLHARGRPSRLFSFSDLGDLVRWARSAEPDFAYLVAVGGDATLSAAATLAVRRAVPFVPLPKGFGNVFARVFGHQGRPEQVLEVLEHGKVRMVDVGVGGGELFLSHRSYGALEHVQAIAERGRRQPRSRILRHLWYYDVARRFFFSTRLPGIRVEVDGAAVADDAVLVTVANVETYHGFLPLTPKASPIDGMFDVFVMPRMLPATLLTHLVRIMLHAPGRWRGVSLVRGRSVVVTSDQGREELITWRRALPLLVPPGAMQALERRTVADDAPVVRAAGGSG